MKRTSVLTLFVLFIGTLLAQPVSEEVLAYVPLTEPMAQAPQSVVQPIVTPTVSVRSVHVQPIQKPAPASYKAQPLATTCQSSVSGSVSVTSGATALSETSLSAPDPQSCFTSTSMYLTHRGEAAPELSATTTDAVIRRVRPGSQGGKDPGEPFLDPVGDIPFALFALLLAGYGLTLARRRKPA